MNRTQKIVLAASGLVVAVLAAVAVPSVVAAASWAAERLAPAASPADGADALPDDLPDGYVSVGEGTFVPKDSPAGCDEPVWLHLGAMSAKLSGDLVDRGEREFAAGTVGLDDAGRIVTYTVAPGDALYAIGDRFCIANALTIATLNHTRTIHPDEVLLLHPNGRIPWVPYFSPHDAPAGYEQIPYQLAIEAMSAAAAAGDIDAMRAIFEGELAALFPNPADADMIAQALADGDLAVLRQMFA